MGLRGNYFSKTRRMKEWYRGMKHTDNDFKLGRPAPCCCFETTVIMRLNPVNLFVRQVPSMWRFFRVGSTEVGGFRERHATGNVQQLRKMIQFICHQICKYNTSIQEKKNKNNFHSNCYRRAKPWFWGALIFSQQSSEDVPQTTAKHLGQIWPNQGSIFQ